MTEREARTHVTRLLRAVGAGDEGAWDELLGVLYGELHRMAVARVDGAAQMRTLQPTALVNEAYLRMVEDGVVWENRRHFFFAAARAMHDIIVDAARKRASQKRGGDWRRVDLEKLEFAIDAPANDMLALEEALSRLEREAPERARGFAPDGS